MDKIPEEKLQICKHCGEKEAVRIFIKTPTGQSGIVIACGACKRLEEEALVQLDK